MVEMARRALEWTAAGRRAALCVVVRTWGSSPREVGALMAVRDDGQMAGSVSGGCVEGQVLLHALNVIRRGQPCLARFGTSDDKAWEAGAPCGGDIEVAVVPYDAELHDPLMRALAAGRTVDFMLSLDGIARAEDLLRAADVDLLFDQARSGGVQPLDAGFYREGQAEGPDGFHPFRDAQAVLPEGARPEAHWAEPFFVDEARAVLDGAAGGKVAGICGAPVFVCRYGARPRIVCVGAVHIAQALCAIAKQAGYETCVVDPRPAFAAPERFACADELVRAWPQDAFPKLGIGPQTAVCALTHDPKIDVPALACACATPAFYIGCLGHAETLADRRRALLDAGVAEEQIARIHGPIGLWIGGRTPGEIALSAVAQIQAARKGRLGQRMQMAGHTLDFYTDDEMARIAAWRVAKAG